MDALRNGIDAFVMHSRYNAEFPPDLDIVNPDMIDANFEVNVSNAVSLEQAFTALDSSYKDIANAKENLSTSEDGTTFIYEFLYASDVHKGVITSNDIPNFASTLENYVETNDPVFADVLQYVDSLIIDTFGLDELNEKSYTSNYVFNDTTVLTLDVEDAKSAWNIDPIMGPDENPFLVSISDDATEASVYTADDQASITVGGLDTVAQTLVDDGMYADFDEAYEEALFAVFEELTGGETDPFMGA